MVFSDDDLKRLKDPDEIDLNGLTFGEFKGILDRLEAAEKVCLYVYGLPDYRDLTERQLLFEWRKAAGK